MCSYFLKISICSICLVEFRREVKDERTTYTVCEHERRCWQLDLHLISFSSSLFRLHHHHLRWDSGIQHVPPYTRMQTSLVVAASRELMRLDDTRGRWKCEGIDIFSCLPAFPFSTKPFKRYRGVCVIDWNDKAAGIYDDRKAHTVFGRKRRNAEIRRRFASLNFILFQLLFAWAIIIISRQWWDIMKLDRNCNSTRLISTHQTWQWGNHNEASRYVLRGRMSERVLH